MKKVIKTILLMIIIMLGFMMSSYAKEEYIATSYIDNPETEIVKDLMYVRGWVMTNDANATIKFYIDGQEQKYQDFKREERPDVIKAITGYGGKEKNPNPGYITYINMSHVTDGTHLFTVEVVSSEGKVLTKENRNITVKKYVAKTDIDAPNNGQTISTNMYVRGWYMSDDKNANVKMYIDNQEIKNITLMRETRLDVLNAIKGYGDVSINMKPGFITNIDMSNIKDGEHQFKVTILTEDGREMTAETRNIVVKKYNATADIDNPLNEYAREQMYVRGWYMTDDEKATMKMYIDDMELTGYSITREKRPDVLKAIQGYGGANKNPTPGFVTTVDISNITDGQHIFKIELYSRTGEKILTQIRNITVKKYEATSYLDEPLDKIVKDEMYVRGWVMTNDTKATIDIYIDGNKQNNIQITREQREDVIGAIQGYGGKEKNPNPGYKTYINLSNKTDGIHTIMIEVKSREGEILLQESRNFELKKYVAKTDIDKPDGKDIISTNMSIRGWYMSDDKDAIVKMYLDNKEISNVSITKEERPDVLNAIKGYGDKSINPKPGYTGNIDMSNVTDGNHTYTVKVFSKSGRELTSETRNITVKKYDAISDINEPEQNSTQKTSMKIRGWVMTQDENATIEYYIDDKKIENSTISRVERQDVLNVYEGKQYGYKEQNPLPGFEAVIDTSSYKDGIHTFKIIVKSRTGEIINTNAKTFYIKKYDAKMYIDEPTSQKIVRNDKLTIRGWAMAQLDNSKIKITIDNNIISNVTREKRPDVIESVTGYGDETINPTPGFKVEVNTSNYAEGYHTIKVEVISKLNEVMTSQTVRFKINREFQLGIDVSEHQKTIDWDKVKASGIDFAIIRCGYGKNVTSQDDKMFQRNITECERLGIPYGVYIYSYADSREGARDEVAHMERLLNGRNPSYGVWIDMEDADGYKAINGITNETCIEICDEFCKIMKEKGYKAGIYANVDWLTNRLNAECLKQYPKWVAQWNDEYTYSERCVVWQYTSSGRLEGIDGPVDMNKWYGYK